MISRTEKYIARVNEELLKFPAPADKIAFLRLKLEDWDERYARFIETEGDSCPGATAFDFSSTIGALGALVGQLERRAA